MLPRLMTVSYWGMSLGSDGGVTSISVGQVLHLTTILASTVGSGSVMLGIGHLVQCLGRAVRSDDPPQFTRDTR